MNLQDKTILVSGGGSGLGAATAAALVAAGARVVVADVNAETGRATCATLGDAAMFVPMDVTNADAVAEAVDRARGHGGPLGGAVNCAGIALARRVLGREGPHELDAFRRVIEINLVGTFNVIRLVSAALAENEPDADGERGVIVNTASVAAFDGQIGQAAYAASKGGIVGMTLPLARDLARHGIRVVTVAPGIFDTPLLGQLPDTVRQTLGEQVPFPSRLGRPQEFGLLARHIFENPMLNGEVIRLDGAIRMPPR